MALEWTRRELLRGVGGLGALSLGVAAAGCGDTDERRLIFLNWPLYIDKNLLTDFTKRSGASVTYEIYDSNDALLRRIEQSKTRRRGGANNGFDLIVPSDSLFERLRDNDQITELPKSLAGRDNLGERFLSSSYDPGCRFSVPWATGTTGIGYSKKAFAEPPSWDVFLEASVEGKATLLNETRDAMAAALFVLEEDPNTKDAATIAAAGRKLAEMASVVDRFDSSGYIESLVSGDTVVAQAYSSDLLQGQQDNPDLAFVVPDAGGLRWVDVVCIPDNASHPEIAQQFIEFYLEPEVSAANAVEIQADTGNEAALEFVPADLRNNEIVFDAERDSVVFTKFLGTSIEDRYGKAFAEAKK